MNKETKKACSLLDEKEAKRKQLVTKNEAEIKSCNEKLTALHSALDKADSAEQYKTLLQEIRDYEATLKYLEKKLSEAQDTILTAEEFKNTIKAINSSFETIQAEQRVLIVSEIEKLEKLLLDYDSDVTELNKLMARTHELYKKGKPTVFNAQTILANEPEKRVFIEAFYKMKNARDVLKRFKA